MINKKIASEIAIGIILLVAIAIGGIFYWQNQKSIQQPEQRACTMEAKLCDDGSYVSRTGPNCEFTPCPENKSTQMANPASTYCVENGGESEIRTAEDGSQTGHCKFNDGSECEEWAYFRKECNKGDSNNISNWQTYKNEEYGFELKYPSDWDKKYRSGMNSKESLVTLISAKTQDNIKKRKTEFNGNIDIYIYKNIEELNADNNIGAKSLEEYLNLDKGSVFKYEKVIFNKYDAFEATLIGYAGYFVIFLEKNGIIYEIGFQSISERKELDEIDNKILSTFKFTK